MKNRIQKTVIKIQPRIIATFGRAALVKNTGPGCELRGATTSELTSAKEWVSLFMHEALICPDPRVL